MQRPLALLVLPLTALLLAGCGGGDDTASAPTLAPEVTAAPTTSTPPAPSASASDLPLPTTPTPAAFDGTEITVTYAGGQVTAPADLPDVPLGSKVRLVVVSDVPEEVHVHTYDLTADLTPGTPGVIEFVATIPGQHEVELEESHKALLELVVR